MAKEMTMEEVLKFGKLYEEARKIGEEAVSFLDEKRTFLRKGEICYRSAEKMRDMLYTKYPGKKMLTEDEVKEMIDGFSKAAHASFKKPEAKTEE